LGGLREPHITWGPRSHPSVDRQSPSLGAYYRRSRQFPLASSARAHQAQTGSPCVPSSSRHCTSVPIGPASFSTSPICRRDVEAGYARRPPVSLTSIRRDLLLSAIVRLLLPARDCGTVFLSTSSLPRHISSETENSLVHGQLAIGSRPSDHYFRSVCLFVCLCRVFLRRL